MSSGKRGGRDRVLIAISSLILLIYLAPYATVFLDGTTEVVPAAAETKPRGITEYSFSRKVLGEVITYQIPSHVTLSPEHLKVYCSKSFPSICEVDEHRTPWLVGVGLFFIAFVNGVVWGLPYFLKPWTKSGSSAKTKSA